MLRFALSGFVALLAAACTGPKPAPPDPVPADKPPVDPPVPTTTNPLALPSDAKELANPKVLSRIAASPHNYFRAVNLRFAQEVCRRFESSLNNLPMVNLHGDAHVEQLAVTQDSVGLSDFDDSVTGPPVIDLVRFGTSVTLTARQRGWQESALVAAFFESYTSTLNGPAEVPLPALVGRIRQTFAKTPEAFLMWAESRMQTPTSEEKLSTEQGYARYVKLMQRIHPERDAAFFALKRWGVLRGEGIGSVTTKRILVRIEGPTPGDEDDVILEGKELRDLSAVKCVDARRGTALRVITGSVLFGQRPDPFLAVIPRAGADTGPPWWIQSWSSTYAELDIQRSLQSEEDLRSVVAFMGSQLARGHTSLVPAPLDVQVREVVSQMLTEERPAIEKAIGELTELTIEAHARLRR